MALAYPLALHFPSFPRAALAQGMDRVVEALKPRHRVPENFSDLAAQLVYDRNSGALLDALEFRTRYASAGAAIARGEWLRIAFAIRLDTDYYQAELYVFPIAGETEAIGLQLNLEGRAYASVYEFQSRADGKFNMRAKRDLLAVLFLVAAEMRAAAFILLPEDGTLGVVAQDDVVDRMSHPKIELHGRRAGLVTGIRVDSLSPDFLRTAWNLPVNDHQVLVTTSGYTVLDLLQPFDES